MLATSYFFSAAFCALWIAAQLGEAHFLKHDQPGSDVLLANPREFAAGGAVHVPPNNEVAGVIGPVDLPGRVPLLDRPVQGRIPRLLNLAPFGHHRVHLVPVPNLARAEIFSNGPYPVADILTLQMERRTVSFDPAQGDVDVRVFGIAMRYSDPLQSCVQVFLQLSHQIAGQLLQVYPFPEFRRDDHFPEPRVACFLPAIEDLRRRNDFALVAKNTGFLALRYALAGDVPSMRPPLPCNPVWRIHHPDGTSLGEQTAGSA